MKVQVDINGLKRKIAVYRTRANSKIFEDLDMAYQSGKADAYLDILCSYLGVTSDEEKLDLEDRIIKEQINENI